MSDESDDDWAESIGVGTRSSGARFWVTNTGDSDTLERLISLVVREWFVRCCSDGVAAPDRDAEASASSFRRASSSRSNLRVDS